MNVTDQYRRLVAYRGSHEDPADPGEVRAMQMVLHIEKRDPPDGHELLVAAATAVARLCLDPRCGASGVWAAPMDAWCDARIRKIARRARGAHWAAVQDVDGVTARIGGAEARALVPGRVGDVDRRVGRLQIGGTRVEGELPRGDGPTVGDGAVGLVLWVDPTLDMSVGKAAAQVGHGAMLGVRLMSESRAEDWFAAGCPLDVRAADPERWAELTAAAQRGTAAAVADAGFTEVEPGSVTVIAEAVGGGR